MGTYCLPGSVIGAVCPAGTFGNASGLGTATCSGPCPRGHFCAAGTTSPTSTPCPGGRFGAVEGLGLDSCSGECTAGYYCPPGSTSRTQAPCTGSAWYCSAASSAPLSVPAGFYSFPVGNATATDAYPCLASTYCTSGVQYDCPAGRYGDSPFLATPLCDRACPSGYYCGVGTTLKTAAPCGNVSVYCPEGSSVPQWVPAGFMSVGGPDAFRSDKTPCTKGTYCAAGVQTSCPYGTEMECLCCWSLRAMPYVMYWL